MEFKIKLTANGSPLTVCHAFGNLYILIYLSGYGGGDYDNFGSGGDSYDDGYDNFGGMGQNFSQDNSVSHM